MCKIQIGAFDYSKNEKGDWVFKADESKLFNKDKTLKNQFAELPRYKVIPQYEEEMINEYQDLLSQGIKEMVTIMSKM